MERRRSIVGAVLLSLGFPGLGQLYCGRWLASVVFFSLSFVGWGSFLTGFVVLGCSWRASVYTGMAAWFAVTLASAIHAAILARRAQSGYRLRSFNLWYFYLLVWIVGWFLPSSGIWRMIKAHWLTTYYLSSESMMPALLPGDIVLVDRRAGSLKSVHRGDIVAVVDPVDGETERLLRVVGMPEDRVEVTPSSLSLNQAPLARVELGAGSYQRAGPQGGWVDQAVLRVKQTLDGSEVVVFEDVEPAKRRTGTWQIREGQLLVLGDNRISSIDAFSFGPLPQERVVGRVFLVLASRDPQTKQWRPERRSLTLP